MIFHHDNVSFYYEIKGTGKPLCFLHGNGEDHTYFAKQIPYFVEHGYSCILMDMRGHGTSTLGNKELNFELFACDVIALFTYLQIDKVSIIGFSDGANTVMQIALSYPHVLDKIVLNGGNISTHGIKSLYQIPIVCGYACLALMAQFLPSLKGKKQVMELMVHHPYVSIKQLANIHVPTLVLVGEKDMVKKRHSQSIHHAIEYSTYIEIVGGNHFIAMKKHMQYNTAIHKFLLEEAYGR